MKCVIPLLVHLLLNLQVTIGDDLYKPARNGELRVGSFNIQVFGLTKLSKTDVVDVLCKVSQIKPQGPL